MHTRILAALLCGCAGASTALADTIVVNDQVQIRESQIDRPKRGSTMADVEKHFGAPLTRHPTVGSPPITPPRPWTPLLSAITVTAASSS